LTIKKRYGNKIQSHFLKEITKWINKDYIIMNLNKYTLTADGKIFADKIASDLFIVD